MYMNTNRATASCTLRVLILPVFVFVFLLNKMYFSIIQSDYIKKQVLFKINLSYINTIGEPEVYGHSKVK